MSLLTWRAASAAATTPTSDAGATALQGRMSGAEVVVRWHRSRDPFTQGQNITGAPTLEAAKVACERHAQQRTDVP
jgi:hypothetical protein